MKYVASRFLLWDKLAFLAPLALLTTHAGAPAGVVRDEHRTDLETVIGEVAAVAEAAGARVDPATILGMFDRVPAGMKSSIQRDAEANRATELDAIGGASCARRNDTASTWRSPRGSSTNSAPSKPTGPCVKDIRAAGLTNAGTCLPNAPAVRPTGS